MLTRTIKSDSRLDIRVRLFLALFNNEQNRYPAKLNELLYSFDIRGPHEYKLAIWNSPDESILALIAPTTLADLNFFLAWQSVYVVISSSLQPDFKAATLELLMSDPADSKLPEEYKQKLYSEIDQLSNALNARIPDFGAQLQVVLGRLQELPEAAWTLDDSKLRVIAEAFKANRNITAFSGTAKPKSPKGAVTADML
jgi:hypothetical protein